MTNLFNKEDVQKKFKDTEVVIVTFTKKNGDERVMHCTTNPLHIPEDETPEKTSEKPVKKLNEDVMRVFDIEKQAWRSFRFDSITKIE